MILICFGTRPEYIKLRPLMQEMEGVIPYQTLFTGQHLDLVDNVNFDHKLNISAGTNRLDSIFESVLNKINFDIYSAVIVQGDTASAYAIALSAFNHECKVIHLEAGMRTYDVSEPWPEEIYRQCISRLAHIHLAPSDYEAEYLRQERVSGDIHMVGNTVLDNLVGVPVSYGSTVLVTMHRRENHHNMDKWLCTINTLAKENTDLTFVLPLHPNPNVTKHRDILTYVTVAKPLSYDIMIDTIAKCRFIITDSGGIQEEASFLKKKVLVCRKKTERVSLIDKNVIICRDQKQLRDKFYEIKDDYIAPWPSPYGCGTSSRKVVEILKAV